MDATPTRCATRHPRAEHFGILVHLARRRVGLTQEDLAERAGLHRSTIVRWEAGYAVPPPGAFRAVCEALGIDPCGGVVALGYLTPDDLRQAA